MDTYLFSENTPLSMTVLNHYFLLLLPKWIWNWPNYIYIILSFQHVLLKS